MSSSEDLEAVVRRTAALARLRVDEAEVARLARDFGRTLAAFHALAELDLDDAEGVERAGAEAADARPDAPEPRAEASRGRALVDAAPEHEDGFYRVPRTVGGPE